MLFGSSGIRQPFSQNLLSLAPLVGSAVASDAKQVVLATDSRTSRNVLADGIISGLAAGGADVIFGGIAPTPAVALAAGNADAGVMITASHNPEEYNGYKLFRRDGSSYTVKQQEDIEERIQNPAWAKWEEQGTVHSTDIATPHKMSILFEVSVPEKLKVVVDCGNGAGSMVTPDVLAANGASVIPVNCDISGKFARPSEPLEKNLRHIPELVRKTGASCAVVNDGDADRMMAFDNRGRYVEGDQLLSLFAKYLDVKRVVTTVDASMAIEEVAEVHRTPVGDSFVSEELLSWGEFGGEPSGSWIFPKHSLCPDGPYAAALFAEISSEWDVADELDALPKYTILRDSLMTPNGKKIMESLGAENAADGIRVSDETGWYLIRASGTEPKVRCTAEGRTKVDAEYMLEQGMNLLKRAAKEVM